MEQIKNSQNIYLNLRSGVKVKELSEVDLFNSIVEIIGRAYFEAGQVNTADAERIKQEANILVRDLSVDFKNATMQEISEAFRRGVRKHYGDYFGLSIATYTSWINSFLNDTERKSALANINLLPHKKELTEEEKAAIEEQTLIDIVNEYKKLGKVYNFGNARYNLLVKRGYISEYDYLDNMDVAKKIVYNELNLAIENAKANGNRAEIKKLSGEIESMMEGEIERVKKKAFEISVNKWASTNIKLYEKRNSKEPHHPQ